MADLERQLSAGSKSSLLSSSSTLSLEDFDDAQLPVSKPLPPISKERTPEVDSLSQKTGSSRRSRPGSKRKEEALAPLSASSRRTVSFIDRDILTKLENQVDSSTVYETFTRTTYDGREILMVTVDVQTEMTMLTKDDGHDSRPVSVKSSRTSPTLQRGGTPSTHSLNMDAGDSDEAAFSDKEDSDGGDDERKSNKSPTKSRSKSSLTPTKSGTDVKTSPPQFFEGLKIYPEPCFNDEFGIPMPELDMDSELSDIDDDAKPATNRALDDVKEEEEEEDIPSIGPPQILKYKRESDAKDPDLSSQGEAAEGDPSGGIPVPPMANGTCEFCGENVKPFPTYEQQVKQTPNELYCCEKYREFVDFTLTQSKPKEPEKEKKIDILPHAPYGSKAARKAAKERAQARARDREQEKIRQQMAAAQQRAAATSHQDHGGGGNFYSFSRQMKTINYSLASVRCLEEGWTNRPPSPIEKDKGPSAFLPEPLVYEPSDFDLTHDGATIPGTSRRERFDPGVVVKYYPEGKKFLTMFRNGSGNVFYPSGNIAIVVIRVDKGQYEYIVQEDTSNQPKVLAVFQPNGKACCYYNSGLLRMCLDEIGGVEHDARGARRRKWNWRDIESNPVQTPPFQPICFALNPLVSIRVMTQDNIALTLRTQTRSCRFSVGSKLKVISKDLIPPHEIEMDSIYMSAAKVKVETLLSKISNLLKFPKSPKLDAIKPPQHVTLLAERTEKLRKEKNLQTEKKNQPQSVRVN